MIDWRNTPPPAAHGHTLRIIRVPESRPLRCLTTSEQITGCPTHFIGRRTHPCTGDECKACAEGIGWKWHGYLGVKISGSGEHCLLELTATAAQPLLEYQNAHKTIRGTLFEASRPSGKLNGRIWIKILPPMQDLPQLPISPDIPAILAVVWGLARPAVEPRGIVKNTRAIGVNHRKHTAADIAAELKELHRHAD